MKIKILIISLAVILFGGINSVVAMEPYYMISSKGVEITSEQYNHLINLGLEDLYIKNIDDVSLEYFMNVNRLYIITKYFKTTNAPLTFSRNASSINYPISIELSKEKYEEEIFQINNQPIELLGGTGSTTSSYKTLSFVYGDPVDGKRKVMIRIVWSKMPATRRIDYATFSFNKSATAVGPYGASLFYTGGMTTDYYSETQTNAQSQGVMTVDGPNGSTEYGSTAYFTLPTGGTDLLIQYSELYIKNLPIGTLVCANYKHQESNDNVFPNARIYMSSGHIVKVGSKLGADYDSKFSTQKVCTSVQ